MMHRIVEAHALPDYRLRLRFDGGAEGVVDLSELVGRGVFAAWQSPGAFDQVRVDALTGTVSWPGGIDLCPDNLYRDIIGGSLPGTSRASATAQ